jgi:hypothetical protein
MFSELDHVIFPDSCEVIEIVPSQHYVYPIFKNGSSSLYKTLKKSSWSVIKDRDINDIQCPITVYLRDPKDRFISGINTFLYFAKRDGLKLDTPTVLWVVKNFLWIDRHFCPQFFWLINLARYSQAPLILKNIKDINDVVDINHRAGVEPPNDNLLTQLDEYMPWDKLELYFYLDQILIDKIGTSVDFAHILQDIKHNHSNLYNDVFGKNLEIVNVLCKT